MISIISVERRNLAWAEDAAGEYAQRLRRFVPCQMIAVKQDKRGKNQNAAAMMAEEASRIRAALPKDAFVIALDDKGKTFTSSALAHFLGRHHDQGQKLAFVIGGTDGLCDSIKQQAHLCLSLSSLTLPHALAKVVLIEQIYRGFCILNDHPYHRE